jgi:hypothetical protein
VVAELVRAIAQRSASRHPSGKGLSDCLRKLIEVKVRGRHIQE